MTRRPSAHLFARPRKPLVPTKLACPKSDQHGLRRNPRQRSRARVEAPLRVISVQKGRRGKVSAQGRMTPRRALKKAAAKGIPSRVREKESLNGSKVCHNGGIGFSCPSYYYYIPTEPKICCHTGDIPSSSQPTCMPLSLST